MTVATETVIDPVLDDEHERFTHIVLEVWKLHDSDEIVPLGNSVVEGQVFGTTVTALCGRTWIPGRNPQRYPLCAECRDIAAERGWQVPA
jgi:hypothetical protein